jgi:very-long-chain enoyl-CoA reductase
MLLEAVVLFRYLILPLWTPAAAAIALFGVLQLAKGIGEALGDDGGGANLAFSKFSTDPHGWVFSSKYGMALIAIAGLLSSIGGFSWLLRIGAGSKAPAAIMWMSIDSFLSTDRGLLVALMLAAHFARRVLEVLTVHKYSSSMEVPVALEQSSMTLVYTVQILWSVYKVPPDMYQSTIVTIHVPYLGLVPLWPLLGCCTYLTGELGCLYHHLLLAKLRPGGSKAYAIPRGGLFSIFICPHYLLEALSWWGIAVASQHLQAFIIAAGMSSFLLGRSIATKRWYMKKFEDFPAGRW